MNKNQSAADVVYLSSQPDEYYFLWQLQLQIYNFRSVGIPDRKIHILIGYCPQKGLQSDFQGLKISHPDINIHSYPDTRKSKKYPPSLRWHIIAKHFKAYPDLLQATIFHHDSDILFTALPDFNDMLEDECWYASNTRSYLESAYIKLTGGDKLFRSMCRLVGVTTGEVVNDDDNAGGAQYLIKKMNLQFLAKMEKDAERMYKLLIKENHRRKAYTDDRKDSILIQAWTADMWVFWWNTLYYKQCFKIHPGLDFAWADTITEKLGTCRILHYTGALPKENNKIFRKTNFIHYPPFFSDLDEIDPAISSILVKEVIKSYLAEKQALKIRLTDITFILIFENDDLDLIENACTVTDHLLDNFDTNILLIERGDCPRLSKHKLRNGIAYQFNADLDNVTVTTPFTGICNSHTILSKQQILQAITSLRKNPRVALIPHGASGLAVDHLLKAMFVKLRDVKLFDENKNKLSAAGTTDQAVLLSTELFNNLRAEKEIRLLSEKEVIQALRTKGYPLRQLHDCFYQLPPPLRPLTQLANDE